jgi:small redox-active disulfide protein 2
VIIKILGSGCKNCIVLAENAQMAIKEMNFDGIIEKVTDLNEIAKYGLILMPAIVVDEKVVSSGKVLKVEEIKKLFNK